MEISGTSLTTIVNLQNQHKPAADERPAPASITPTSSISQQQNLAASGQSVNELVGLATGPDKPQHESPQLSSHRVNPSISQQELAQIQELARIDREVRAHELAHASVGGAFAGSASFSLTRGPDGRLYATGGEVNIDTSRVANSPQATIDKARIIIAAASAPANPSAQDLRVAAQAQAMLIEAQAELATSRVEEPRAETEGEDAVTETDLSSEQQSAAVALREEEQEKQERIQELREEFAAQLSDLNSRLNQVHRNLIDAGVIENLNPGAIIDMLI